MSQWKYQITFYQLPKLECEEKEIIKCNQRGECFVHDTCQGGGMEWLEALFAKKGQEGWELVQSGYHHRELLCIWKMKVES